MSFRSGLTIALTLLAGCSSGGVSTVTITPRASTGPVPGAGVCLADQPCTLTGTMMLERRSGDNSWAALSQGEACAPLLLPESAYQKSRFWNNKQVRVSGTALARGPVASPEILLLQYRDRWLSPSICSKSDLVLYVDEIVATK